jgi:glucose/arabinose dehydrogenase
VSAVLHCEAAIGYNVGVGSFVIRVACVVACCAASLAAAPAAGFALPAQFEEVELAAGLTKPTAVAFAPDGRMFIAEQAGRVRVREADGTLRADPLIDWRDRVNAFSGRGMIGIATDRDFADNGYLYLLFVADNDATDDDGPHSSRLVRVTVSAGSDVVAEKTLLGGEADQGECGWPPPDGNHSTVEDAYLDCLPAWGTTHVVGTVASDPRDGTLWVGTGDATNVAFNDGNRPRRMQTYNEESFAGKLLHIDREGRGLPGHPFCPGASDRDRACAKIYAKGFRNPYRFTIPTTPGAPPIVADVGNEQREELNFARPGGNYGWPCWEGSDHRPGYYANYVDCQPYQQIVSGVVQGPENVDPPDFEYHHGGGKASILAGPVYEGDQYPQEYRGSLFFGDFSLGFIRRFAPAGSGGWEITPSAVTSFTDPSSALPFTQRGAFTQMTSAPNGDLVITDFLTFGPSGVGPGRVVRVAYPASNQRPIANAAIVCDEVDGPCDEVDPGDEVRFSAEGSRDPDTDPIAYAWDFDGDGLTDSTEREPERTFSAQGIHPVRLTVTDGRGGSAEATVAVLVAGHAADPLPSAPRVESASPPASAPALVEPIRVAPAVRLAAPWPGRRRTVRTISGTLTGIEARPAVGVALARRAGARCRWWNARVRRFGRPASCRRPVWTAARVRSTADGWRFNAALRAAVARRPGAIRVRAVVRGRTVAQVTVRVSAAR